MRRKCIADICEHRYILYLRGSKLLSHGILFSNPEIADIISSWQVLFGVVVQIQGCKRKHPGQELETNVSLSIRFRVRKVGRVSHSLRTHRVYITLNSNLFSHSGKLQIWNIPGLSGLSSSSSSSEQYKHHPKS